MITTTGLFSARSSDFVLSILFSVFNFKSRDLGGRGGGLATGFSFTKNGFGELKLEFNSFWWIDSSLGSFEFTFFWLNGLVSSDELLDCITEIASSLFLCCISTFFSSTLLSLCSCLSSCLLISFEIVVANRSFDVWIGLSSFNSFTIFSKFSF